MILIWTGLCALVSLLVLLVEFRKIGVLSRGLLIFQLLLFALVFVSWLGISF